MAVDMRKRVSLVKRVEYRPGMFTAGFVPHFPRVRSRLLQNDPVALSRVFALAAQGRTFVSVD